MFTSWLFTCFTLHNFALFSEFYHEAHGRFCAFTLFWSVFVHAVTVNCCWSVWSCRSDSDASCCLWFWKLFTVHVLVSCFWCLSFGCRLEMRSLISGAHFHLICDDGTQMQTKDWTNPLLSEMNVNMSVHEAMSHAFNFHIIITFKCFEMTSQDLLYQYSAAFIFSSVRFAQKMTLCTYNIQLLL